MAAIFAEKNRHFRHGQDRSSVPNQEQAPRGLRNPVGLPSGPFQQASDQMARCMAGLSARTEGMEHHNVGLKNPGKPKPAKSVSRPSRLAGQVGLSPENQAHLKNCAE